MNRIPGLIPGLKCPICRGNIYGEHDIDLGVEPKCLKCGDKNRPIIQCPYCEIRFRHDGKEDYQYCPKCNAELIC